VPTTHTAPQMHEPEENTEICQACNYARRGRVVS